MTLSALIRKRDVGNLATAIRAFPATNPKDAGAVARVAAVAVAEVRSRGSGDPDRHCWPHSGAMNTAEIEKFLSRAAHFKNKGLTADEAESLADKLLFRDRDGDDRHVCFECAHLRGLVRWSCRKFQKAEVGEDLPREIVLKLQRCTGFTGRTPPD